MVTSQGIPAHCPFYCDEQCQRNSLWIDMGVAGVLSGLTIIVSVINVYLHLSHFNNPYFQSKIIIILLMAPFYCFTSMSSIIWPSMEAYLTLVRDVYEAILLFVFFYLIFAYLAYDDEKDQINDKKLYTTMIANEKEVAHFWPFNYCQKPYQLTSWKKAKHFTYRCKKYILQFLVIKPLATLFMIVFYPFLERNFSFAPVIASIINWIVMISISYSLYYLVLFYHALKVPLAPYSPLLKFLTIKITLFFTFWQKIVIGILEQPVFQCFDHHSPIFNEKVIVSKFENTLICFEMLCMAIAGGIAYTYKNYELKNKRFGNISAVFHDAVKTFKKDLRLIKPPDKFTFTPEAQHETELSDVKDMKRESLVVRNQIQDRLSTKLLQDYL